MSLSSLPNEEKPRERLRLHGEKALSLVELLAIVLKSGPKGRSSLDVARELLSDFGSLHALFTASVAELRQTRGIGEAKAIELKAVCELGHRIAQEVRLFPIPIQGMDDIVRLLIPKVVDQSQENLYAVSLDTRGNVLAIDTIGKGLVDRLLVHPREVFFPVIRHNASRLVLAHNHPSGDPTPSAQDRKATEALQKASQTLGIPLEDHLIIGKNAYYSLLENRRLAL